jgi:DNA-binding transcriptional ArsR family regulator
MRLEADGPLPIRRRAPSREIDGEIVILNPATGAVTHLDRLGTMIWHLLDQSTTVQQLVDDLSTAFEVAPPTVERDLRVFLGALADAGLLDAATESG